MAGDLDLQSLAGRIRYVRLALAPMNGGHVSYARLAEILTDRMKRPKPFKASTVQGWEEGAEPDLRTLEAIADLIGAPRSWLAFGEGEPPAGAEEALVRSQAIRSVAKGPRQREGKPPISGKEPDPTPIFPTEHRKGEGA